MNVQIRASPKQLFFFLCGTRFVCMLCFCCIYILQYFDFVWSNINSSFPFSNLKYVPDAAGTQNILAARYTLHDGLPPFDVTNLCHCVCLCFMCVMLETTREFKSRRRGIRSMKCWPRFRYQLMLYVMTSSMHSRSIILCYPLNCHSIILLWSQMMAGVRK